MSGIILSSSVRQNLLSLQSTADLLSTTQNHLATGKKVNTALDNPTNYFTAASLDNRASDINNLLDGIGNGVQILQAANTGITSLQKLVDTAKSIANQALQTSVGYSTKANVDVTGTGAGVGTTTAADLNAGKLGGSVITFKTATGTLAVTIGSTFATGSGTATVKTLDQLNSVLVSNGVAVSASISSTANTLTFTSTNDAASQTITARAPPRPARVLISRLLRPPSEPSMLRSPMRLRRPPAPTWSPSTTGSSSRSTPLRRTLRSTGSTCWAVTTSSWCSTKPASRP